MLRTALRSVSAAATGRKKVNVAKAALANMDQHRKRSDATHSSSTAPKQRKSGQIKQVDQLKVEIESAGKEASANNQKNPASDNEDTFTVRPRRSGRLLKVPASTTDYYSIASPIPLSVKKATLAGLDQHRKRPDATHSSSTAPKQRKSCQNKVNQLEMGVESAGKEVPASITELDASIVRPRRSSRLHKVSLPVTDSCPLEGKSIGASDSSMKTDDKKSAPVTVRKSSPIRKRIEIEKAISSSSGFELNQLPPSSIGSTTSARLAAQKKDKVLSPLSFIKGSGRKGDNTPWKPMDEVHKLLFGPHVRLVKLELPPSTKVKTTPPSTFTSTGNGGSGIVGITPLPNPGGSNDLYCSPLVDSPTFGSSFGPQLKSNGSASANSISPHCSRAETSINACADGPIPIIGPSSQVNRGALNHLNLIEGLSPLSLAWNNSEVARDSSSDLILFGSASDDKAMDSILPSSSSFIPLSLTACSAINNDSLVTDQTLDASSSAFYPPIEERAHMVQSLLEEAMSKELVELQDVDTFFARLAQSSRELETTEAIDSLSQTTMKVASSRLLKGTLKTQDNCSSTDSLLHGSTEKSSAIGRSIPSSKEVSSSQILLPARAGFSGEKKAANCPPCPRY